MNTDAIKEDIELVCEICHQGQPKYDVVEDWLGIDIDVQSVVFTIAVLLVFGIIR